MTFKIKKVLENFENSQNTYDMFVCVCVCVCACACAHDYFLSLKS